jgi:hypothetical protein
LGSAGGAAKAEETMPESGRRERKWRRLVMGREVVEGGSGDGWLADAEEGVSEAGRKGFAASEGTAWKKQRYGMRVLVTD